MVRKISLVLVLFLAISLVFQGSTAKTSPEDELEAPVYLLGEPKSGEILLEQDKQEQVYPASITKIMTLLLTMEALENEQIALEEEVIVPREAEDIPGTTIFLQQGEKITVDDLITAIAVGSANDASIAIAKHISGTVDNFVDEMNDKARELGMKNTNFENPHGLHHDEHVTTAEDIFIMASELGKYEEIHDWLEIWLIEDFLQGKKVVEDDEEGIFLSNTNRLVNQYPGCDGFKTGFTEESKHSITATAKQNGERYIAIIMSHEDSDGRFEEAMNLLDYGFANYQTNTILEKGDLVARVKINKGDQEYLPLLVKEELVAVTEESDEIEIEEEHQIPDDLSPPIVEGDKVGEYQISYGNKESQVALIAGEDVKEAGITDHFSRLIKNWMSFWTGEK
ncbi:D-alanyl-D-alanine carboxypeptidase family protein [Natranaerobius thermophilus]|uniref:serine-type D-Ala-D-Ala carboxypeptidase n=1 Tax=Natranaerobius thermophilus (strain ATCC BAA-1301 / DSM 18059 / JW/NM-WN-LF) TaxID=457570 RepID=B2A4Z6_NATTJ|nr:D-alanyl-D-alanine carboxypeptidase family protein [Natranaerobius thermophilus]ACB85238.1 Serine-type D-Ala-D-Ala carboxypeptidase [Natranaerobius thermophilus JW/NM-WN-LF]